MKLLHLAAMCRADISSSIAFYEDSIPSQSYFSVTIRKKQLPFQEFSFFSETRQANIRIISIPLLRGLGCLIQLFNNQNSSRPLDSYFLSFEALKWRSRLAYRIDTDFCKEIRNREGASYSKQALCSLSRIVYYSPYKNNTALYALQGTITPTQPESKYKVYCIDDYGHRCSTNEMINDNLFPKIESEESLINIDFTLSLTKPIEEKHCIFLVTEECLPFSKPTFSFRLFSRQAFQAFVFSSPINNISLNNPMDYHDWFVNHHRKSSSQLKRQTETSFSYQPLISILVPLYKTPKRFLFEMVQSVIQQTYSNWELILANASKEEKELSDALCYLINNGDERIRCIELSCNGGISKNTNEALKNAKGEFISLLDHDDFLEPDALFEIVKALNTNPEIDLLYSDEDHMITDKNFYCNPHFKPDFSPELLTTCNYITHFTTIRRSLALEVGGFDSACDGAQDFDIILKASEKTRNVYHIPRILYHWREHENSTASDIENKTYAIDAGRLAVQKYHERLNTNASVTTFAPCIYLSHYQVPNSNSLEIIIVDDGFGFPSSLSSFLSKTKTNKLLQKTTATLLSPHSSSFTELKYLFENTINTANLSLPKALNNAVNASQADYVLFLPSSSQHFSDNFCLSLLGLTAQNNIGAVGAKSYYFDDSIENAGIILSREKTILHSFRFFPSTSLSYQLKTHCVQNVSAVSYRGMMCSRKTFLSVHGFDELFTSSFFDVDFCLRLIQSGKRCVFNPMAEYTHLSPKQSQDISQNHQEATKDKALFLTKWNTLLTDGDPYYNPNLNLSTEYWNLPYYE